MTVSTRSVLKAAGGAGSAWWASFGKGSAVDVWTNTELAEVLSAAAAEGADPDAVAALRARHQATTAG